jgi:hypothetical protein
VGGGKDEEAVSGDFKVGWREGAREDELIPCFVLVSLSDTRVNMEYRALRHKSQEGGETKGWTGEDLGRLYAECCRTREEPGIDRVRRAFKVRSALLSPVEGEKLR